MSWYYYLEEKLVFPFKARCVAIRSVSPLKMGEEVEVIAMESAGSDSNSSRLVSPTNAATFKQCLSQHRIARASGVSPTKSS